MGCERQMRNYNVTDGVLEKENKRTYSIGGHTNDTDDDIVRLTTLAMPWFTSYMNNNM